VCFATCYLVCECVGVGCAEVADKRWRRSSEKSVRDDGSEAVKGGHIGLYRMTKRPRLDHGRLTSDTLKRNSIVVMKMASTGVKDGVGRSHGEALRALGGLLSQGHEGWARIDIGESLLARCA